RRNALMKKGLKRGLANPLHTVKNNVRRSALTKKGLKRRPGAGGTRAGK
ncbi:hypothetical protein MELA_00349, partial [Candidatus Methylomirabilis lanthanidiphila]